MSDFYLLTEIEVTEPLRPVPLSPGTRGVGIVLRRHGVPVGFALREIGPETVLTTQWLAHLVLEEAGERIVREALRDAIPVEDRAPSPAPLSLTVSICTRDHPDLVIRCVSSLQKLQRPGRDRLSFFEILIVDNAPSDDRTREAAEAIGGEVRYVREPVPGLDFARNRAAAEARGDVIAFVDDDAVVDRGWLQGLASAWADYPDAGGFTGLVLPLELRTPAQVTFERRGGFRRGFDRIKFGRTMPGNPLYPSGTGFGAGANMAFRRDALRALGGFDEALDTGAPLPGGGDLDIFYRIVRSGRPLVYEPRFLVYHQHRETHGGLRRQYYTWGLGFMAFVTKSSQQSREDRGERTKLRQLTRWFFSDALWRLWRSLRGRDPLTPDLVAAEFVGGLVGKFGEYGRSQRRVARLRETAA